INPVSLDCAFDALEEAGVACDYEQAYDVATGVALEGGIERAVALAAQSETAIVFVGLPDSTESEGSDRETMDMPAAHVELIERVSAVNPRTVVVLQGGSPVSVPWRKLPAAILLCYLGGCQGGHAAVDLLLGAASPSGKLAETWPLELADTPAVQWYPAAARQALYVESIYVGYRYYDTAGVEVAYPFGYGRSYTEFEYRDIAVSQDGNHVTVTCVAENTGDMFGKEAVQLYVAPMNPKTLKPYQELKGFQKVALAPHEHTVVTFELDHDAFSYFDSQDQAWRVGPGEYELRIAASSRDVRLALRLHIDGDASQAVSSVGAGTDGEDLASQVPQTYRTPHASRFSIDDFKTLYGRDLPRPLTAMRPYTINSTIADLRTSTIGKIAVYFINRELKNLLRDKPDERQLLSSSILDIPLRNVAMSGIDMLFVYGVVDVLNYHFVRGVKKIVFKREQS
ncbi:MAG: glycoside hydrolase family 3 C-terminal domain-containing protein, partial [Raoultibacter sp.]